MSDLISRICHFDTLLLQNLLIRNAYHQHDIFIFVNDSSAYLISKWWKTGNIFKSLHRCLRNQLSEPYHHPISILRLPNPITNLSQTASKQPHHLIFDTWISIFIDDEALFYLHVKLFAKGYLTDDVHNCKIWEYGMLLINTLLCTCNLIDNIFGTPYFWCNSIFRPNVTWPIHTLKHWHLIIHTICFWSNSLL